MSDTPYKMEPHSFNRTIVSYPYCSKCGLVRLKNQLTDWCVSKGCDYREHPQYKQKVHKFTAPSWAE